MIQPRKYIISMQRRKTFLFFNNVYIINSLEIIQLNLI